MSDWMIGGAMVTLMLFGAIVGLFIGWMCAKDQIAIVQADLDTERTHHTECRSLRLAEAHEAGKLRHANVELQARLNRARDLMYDSSVIRHSSHYQQLRMLLDPESVSREADDEVKRFGQQLSKELSAAFYKSTNPAAVSFSVPVDGDIPIPPPKSW